MCSATVGRALARVAACMQNVETASLDSYSGVATSPYARQPGLLLARQARGTVIVVEQDEAGAFEVSAPALDVVVGAIAAGAPALLVLPTRIGAEEDAARLQRSREVTQHARQFLARNVEERCIRVHAVEPIRRKLEIQEILLPHLASAERPGHRCKARCTFEPDRDMAELGECFQVTARTAAQIENAKRRLA